MQTISRNVIATLIGALVYAAAMSISWAQSAPNKDLDRSGDPPRWYQEDGTSHGYYLTLKKEADAVFGESVAACKHGDGAARATCTQEARRVLAQDMADAKTKSRENP